MDKILKEKLVKLATQSAANSYSPYSNYAVGSAVCGTSGQIYCGTNIENASYSLTMCAERIAIFKGVASGEKSFSAIAIVSTCGDNFPYPCGACLQVMTEFCADLDIVLVNKNGEEKITTLKEIFPSPFVL